MMEILDTQYTLGNTTITKLFQILKTNKAFSPDKLNPALLKQAIRTEFACRLKCT